MRSFLSIIAFGALSLISIQNSFSRDLIKINHQGICELQACGGSLVTIQMSTRTPELGQGQEVDSDLKRYLEQRFAQITGSSVNPLLSIRFSKCPSFDESNLNGVEVIDVFQEGDVQDGEASCNKIGEVLNTEVSASLGDTNGRDPITTDVPGCFRKPGENHLCQANHIAGEEGLAEEEKCLYAQPTPEFQAEYPELYRECFGAPEKKTLGDFIKKFIGSIRIPGQNK